MKIKNLITGISLVSVIATASIGCKKGYLDINQNPNSPTTESMTPALILPRAIHATGARMAVNYDWTARWMGYWSRSGTFGPSSEEESYAITTQFQATQWSGWYDQLFDYYTLEQKAKASGQTFYEGIAKTMKTVGFMYLVDMYNNVPYTKAFDLAGNVLPAYDKGEVVYDSLFAQLDQALLLIGNADLAANPDIATADIMFHGDISMWKKLINTQRLKLVIRESNVAGFNASAQIAKVTSEGYIGAGETASINPGYAQSRNPQSVSQQNPFWDAFKNDVENNVIDNYNRANNYVLNVYRNNNDDRYKRVFSPAATGGAYAGTNYGNISPDLPAAQLSMVSGPGLAKSPSQAQWFFTSVESLFLQAEAIERGLIPGNAQTAFNAAITESFVWLGVPNAVAAANTYYSQPVAIVNWAGATTSADRVKLIVTQKYLALAGTNNFEAWVDYRRVGVPNVPLSLSPGVGSNIPVRLRYPANEYAYNSANVKLEGDPNPFTSTVFWDK